MRPGAPRRRHRPGPPGRISLVSLCAGQGRDVIGVLPDHPRRDDVRAVLVESDERNAGPARQAAAARGLTQVEVRVADASLAMPRDLSRARIMEVANERWKH